MNGFNIWIFFSLIAFVSFPAHSNQKTSEGFDHDHKNWTRILEEYAKVEGPVTVVNYKEIKENPKTLKKYLNSLSSVSKKKYKTWSKNEKMAFLINAYNAFTVKLIIDHYPVDSIKDIGGWIFGKPWKKEFFRLLGEKRHLDWLEHDFLRKKFSEPRIHFAVNCASIGCPQLRGEAFVGDRLEKQLEDQTKKFMQDRSRNRIDKDKRTIYISKIFDWFEEDFTKGSSTVLKFVAPYITEDPSLQEKIKEGVYDWETLDYDWSLNEVK